LVAVLATAGLALLISRVYPTKSVPIASPKTLVDNHPRSLGFAKSDDDTKGNWRGVYGSEGLVIATEKAILPPYADIRLPRDASVWNKSAASEVRALQEPADPVNRVASAWYSFSDFEIDVDLTDGRTHQLALYLLDWDSTSRQEIVRLTDAKTLQVLDERGVADFTLGRYLVWNIKGHVTFKVLPVAGANSVVSAIFLD
jgi:hypothetical protein